MANIAILIARAVGALEALAVAPTFIVRRRAVERARDDGSARIRRRRDAQAAIAAIRVRSTLGVGADAEGERPSRADVIVVTRVAAAHGAIRTIGVRGASVHAPEEVTWTKHHRAVRAVTIRCGHAIEIRRARCHATATGTPAGAGTAVDRGTSAHARTSSAAGGGPCAALTAFAGCARWAQLEARR
jgi:hypothetical protein